MHPRLSGWDFVKKKLSFLTDFLSGDTLDTRIDAGQGINIQHGKFDKKNKRRALNSHILCSK